jgi:glycosyltransferase involved in cell wall biosynthesis
MKIAYDITFLGHNYFRANNKTGIYRVVEEVLLELLKRRDVEILLTGICDHNPVLTSLLAKNYLQDSLPEEAARNIDAFRSRLGNESSYISFMDQHLIPKVRTIPVGTLRSFLFWGMMRCIAEVQKIDISVRLSPEMDVFHSPFLRLPSSAVTGKTPRVLTIYDLIPVMAPQFTNWRFNLFFRTILKSVDRKRDHIICISEYTKQEFCSYTGMDPAQVFVSPLAAADHFYPVQDEDLLAEIRKKYKIPEGDYFLTLAALQPRKNIPHIIRCFIRYLVSSGRRNVYLVLVGSLGWNYYEIFKTTDRLSEFRGNIIFTGYVPDEELSPIYTGALAFLFPSLYEGFGLPCLEAMQCGAPVVSSNTTSLPEVVGNAGILVDPTDADALCQAMTDLAGNDKLREELRIKGLERAKSFSWNQCADDTVKAYSAAARR